MDMAVEQTRKAEKQCSGDMQCQMKAYEELAVPGAPHQKLATRTGTWTTTSRYWADPSQPPMESAGKAERKMILGGRYLQEDFSGDMMGNPFTGLAITGYDNHTKMFVSTWIDSMSTGIYFFQGHASADGKSIALEGSFEDALKGHVLWHSVTHYLDDDTETFTMHMTQKSGKEEKCEITYKRTK